MASLNAGPHILRHRVTNKLIRYLTEETCQVPNVSAVFPRPPFRWILLHLTRLWGLGFPSCSLRPLLTAYSSESRGYWKRLLLSKDGVIYHCNSMENAISCAKRLSRSKKHQIRKRISKSKQTHWCQSLDSGNYGGFLMFKSNLFVIFRDNLGDLPNSPTRQKQT